MHRRQSHLLPFLLLLIAALICCVQSFRGGAAVAVLKNHACWSLTSFRGRICFAFQRGQTPDPRRWKITLFQPLPQNAPVPAIPAATDPAALPYNLALLRAANRSLLATATNPHTSRAALGFHLASQSNSHFQIPTMQSPITNDKLPMTTYALTVPAWFYLLVPAVLVAFSFRRYRKSARPFTAALRRFDLRLRRRAPWILAAFVAAACLFLETRRRPPAPDILCNIIEPNLLRASAALENDSPLVPQTFSIAALTEPRHSLSSTATRNARAQLLLHLLQTALPSTTPPRATPAAIEIRATPTQTDYLAALLQALQP